MDTLATAGLVHFSVFAHLASSRDALCEKLAKPPLNLKEDDFAGSIELAKICAAWEAAKVMKVTEVQRDANRLSLNLPPELLKGDLERAVKVFEKAEDTELNKYTTPSKAFFERLMGQSETFFETVCLTSVTNLDAQDRNQTSTYGVDVSGGLLKATAQKPFAIPNPKTPEGLRARLTLLGTCWMFCKHKYPAKPHLSTVSVKLFDDLIKHLFGPKVWGLVRLDENGLPIASPHIGHVLCYLHAIFKKTAEDMNEGMDMDQALRGAWKDRDTKTIYFHDAVALSINTAECRALTAPDLQERSRAQSSTKGDGAPTRRVSIDNGGDAATSKAAKNRAKRLKQKAKVADLRAVAKKTGGPGAKVNGMFALKDADRGPGGKAAGKGKGKNKFKDKTDAGESICFNWAKGKPCHTSPCPHKHCCRICEGPHLTAECPSAKK